MKIDIKNKKVVIGASVLAVVAVLGITSTIGHGQINKAQNDYVSVTSSIMNIGESIIDKKSTLIDIEAKIQNLNPDKENQTELKIIIEELEKNNFRDETKINEHIKLQDRFNIEIDKIIGIYEKNNDMKNDLSLTNSIFEIEGLNNFIEEIMTKCNEIYRKEFNESIEKFPVKLVAEKKGWDKVNQFKSVNH